MKLKNEFITHDDGNEQIMISTGTSFNGLVKSNKTASFIVECLKTDTTENEIIQKMLEKYDAPENEISAGVKNIIEILRKINAIDE